MEADLTETVIAKASDENGVVRIGVLALGILAKAELARRMRLTRAERLRTARPSQGEETPEVGLISASRIWECRGDGK